MSTLDFTMAPQIKKSANPYVEYDKAGLREILNHETRKGIDIFALDTRRCIENRYCVQIGIYSIRERLNIAEIFKLKMGYPYFTNYAANVAPRRSSTFQTEQYGVRLMLEHLLDREVAVTRTSNHGHRRKGSCGGWSGFKSTESPFFSIGNTGMAKHPGCNSFGRYR